MTAGNADDAGVLLVMMEFGAKDVAFGMQMAKLNRARKAAEERQRVTMLTARVREPPNEMLKADG